MLRHAMWSRMTSETAETTETADRRSLERSEALLARARELIPGCAQTGSKSPTQWVQGVAPTHVERAEGCRVWDVDGNEYIDYVSALGPIVLGYGHPAVTEAVTRRAEEGSMLSLPHPLQVEVAEQFREAVPCAEMVRFAKSGNDVTTLAAKLARAHTGRDVIATQGYHGWPDVWMAGTELGAGIPDPVGGFTERFDYNDIDRVEEIFDDHEGDVAAVVTTAVNLDEPEDDFLEHLREITDREGALLVFDEVLTGFRFALGGAQERFGVTPDLGCFAKAMANGYSVSALAGRREVMETMERDDFFFSMTYAGGTVPLAAAEATIRTLREEPVFEHIRERGRTLMDGYDELVADHRLEAYTGTRGFPERFSTTFDGDGEVEARTVKSLFLQECLKRGVLTSGAHLVNYGHTEADVEETLDVYDAALGVVSDAVTSGDAASWLEGEPVGSTLRERTGENE